MCVLLANNLIRAGPRKQKQSLGARIMLASNLIGAGREVEAESGACVLLANDLITAGRDVYVLRSPRN